MTLQDWMNWRKRKAAWVAEQLGVDHVSVNRYVAGTRRPAWDVMQKIIELTEGHVTPNDFLRGPRREEGGENSRVA